jgi:hypothetical protein
MCLFLRWCGCFRAFGLLLLLLLFKTQSVLYFVLPGAANIYDRQIQDSLTQNNSNSGANDMK